MRANPDQSRAPSPPAMRAKAMPGEDPATLQTPADIAELFVTMAQPDYREITGASWIFSGAV